MAKIETLSFAANASAIKCLSCSCSFSDKWQRTVKRKFEQVENVALATSFDYSSVARVEIENECAALREALGSQQQSIQELYTELEEERNASSSAANEAMSMILRLQREKAEVQMEARQFKRFAEEKMAHDQQELLAVEDLLYKREQTIQSLTYEVQAYKHRMLSFGYTEAEVEEGNRGGPSHGHSRNPSLIDNCESQYEFPPYDYPPLKCNVSENHGGPVEVDYDVADIEKYAFGESPRGETPSARGHLQNLENRIYDLERTPRNNQMDGADLSFGTKNILEKVVVGQSPRIRQTRHARKFSIESSSSLYGGLVKETTQDTDMENERPGSSFKKTEYFMGPSEDYSNLKKVDNASDIGDDMSDRVYTIDSIHNGLKAPIGICDDYVTTPRDIVDVGDTDVKKLQIRLQALEADRESMKQAIISMRTDKAQLILLKEIAQHLCKDMSPERRLPVKKPSRSFSLISLLKVSPAIF
ncbi:hypothetical protein GIB67_034306 [Kingdonia uniflora]|uniref:GTD-binding domain-containing protein n=1 Tax=Kingdonia uniflora TaxID=39325 RepID=A0A7J7NSF9_9MAGN|nr:hypothetical protein GIB67_034306 [Kingdonia uniflora]